MKHPASLLLTFALLVLAAPKAGAVTFNVIGSETKETFELTFIISDSHGTALASKAWSSASDKYQHEDTNAMLSLQYWSVMFSYDATKTMAHLEAFHKIDPHNSATDAGDTFKWDVARPAATLPVGNTGAKRGFAYKTDYKDHDDSQGKHSDKYDAVLAFSTNMSPPPFFPPPEDVLALEVDGEHRPKPVPDPVNSASLLLFGVLLLTALRRHCPILLK